MEAYANQHTMGFCMHAPTSVLIAAAAAALILQVCGAL
jgi:hypothetical protein